MTLAAARVHRSAPVLPWLRHDLCDHPVVPHDDAVAFLQTWPPRIRSDCSSSLRQSVLIQTEEASASDT